MTNHVSKQPDAPIALVTGGAVRLGRSIALALAHSGMDVVVHYRRSAAAARSLCAEIRSEGQTAWPLSGSLDTPGSCRRFWQRVVARVGSVDLLVNNASVFSRESLLQANAVDFDRHWRINALAPMILTQCFAQEWSRHFFPSSKKIGPQVINLLDRRIATPEAGSIPYAMSKHVLHAFTLSAAIELAPRIAVNAVAPGAVLPPPGSQIINEKAGIAPLTTPCRPEDVASAVCYLAAQKCITGQVIFVDSGQHLWSVDTRSF